MSGTIAGVNSHRRYLWDGKEKDRTFLIHPNASIKILFPDEDEDRTGK
jgi:hypothetical protein